MQLFALPSSAALLLNAPRPLVPTNTLRLRASMIALTIEPEAAAGCIRLEKDELPDCIDAETPGSWWACEDPPKDVPTLQCFQPEALSGCEDEDEEPCLVDGKPWICVDSATWRPDADSEDSF